MEVATPVAAGRRRLWIVLVVIAGAIGFLLWKGLGDATVYFRTADEAVEQRAELGSRRFRVEGEVVAGSVRAVGDGVTFKIEENGARITVDHRGDPPELFRPGIPVVLEGRFEGRRFASDRILVKHTNEYRDKRPDRVKDYRTKDNGA